MIFVFHILIKHLDDEIVTRLIGVITPNEIEMVEFVIIHSDIFLEIGELSCQPRYVLVQRNQN